MQSSFLILSFCNNEVTSSSSENMLGGVTSDTAFTVIVTLTIFIAGYIINRIIEAAKERHRLKELKVYFENLIELLVKPINKQRDEWIKISKKLNEKKEQGISLADVTLAEVSLIKQIDSKDLFKIYFMGKKGDKQKNSEYFGKIVSKLDHIQELKKLVAPNFNDLRSRSERYEADYKNNIQVTSELFDRMVQAYPGGAVAVADIFLIGLDRIRAEWVALGEGGNNYLDMYFAREHYLIPVKSLCQEFIRDSRASQMLRYVSTCLLALDNLDEVKSVYRRHFLIDARAIQTCIIEIKNSIDYLNKV